MSCPCWARRRSDSGTESRNQKTEPLVAQSSIGEVVHYFSELLNRWLWRRSFDKAPTFTEPVRREEESVG
ncbi:hypothetical protein ACFX13_000972 [Malus domestica]